MDDMTQGPHLNFAALCEKVLREGDGVLSLIRVIDRITLTVVTSVPTGVEVPPALQLAPPPISVTFAVGLKSGDFTGSIPLKVRIETPSGFKWPEYETSVHLEGEDRGHAV